jgi:hypothetical protein
MADTGIVHCLTTSALDVPTLTGRLRGDSALARAAEARTCPSGGAIDMHVHAGSLALAVVLMSAVGAGTQVSGQQRADNGRLAARYCPASIPVRICAIRASVGAALLASFSGPARHMMLE